MSASTSGGPPAAGGIRAIRGVYYALVLWIPVETLFVVDADARSGRGTTISKLLGLLLFGLALVERRRCFRRIPAVFWLIASYLAVYAASQLWIPRELDAMFRASQFSAIQLAGLLLISVNLFEDSDFRGSVLRLYGWWMSLVAVGMMLGAFGGALSDAAGRSAIAGLDPNFTAASFALGAVCIAGDPGIFASRRFVGRIAASVLAVAALIMGILQTGSRGGLLVFVSGILGLAICGGKETRNKRLMIAAAVLGALAVLVLREFQHGTVTAARLSSAWNEGDTAGRATIYAAAWAMFRERPLLGYGGVYNLAVLGVRLNSVDGGMFYRSTHNLLLALLTEVGLVGAAPFVAALLCVMRTAWRHGRRTEDALPFALMCALLAVTASLTLNHDKIFWIVLAAAAACGSGRDAAAGCPANDRVGDRPPASGAR